MPNGHAKQPRNAPHRSRLTSPSLSAQHCRRVRWCLFLLPLLLTAMLLVVAVPTHATPSVMATTTTLQEESISSNNKKAITPVVAQDVILRYTFRPSSMALLVHDSGELTAHDLLSGVPLWSADTGGPVMKAEMLQPPSRETMSYDPLSTPLLVHGNQLFMRAPYDNTRRTTTTPVPFEAGANTTQGHTEGEFDYVKDSAHAAAEAAAAPTLLYFMNVSTLLRRQSVVVADTDIYTTTSVSILDIDAVSGRVLRTMTPGTAAGTSFAPGEYDTQPSPSTTSLPELMPVLHVVRYNIFIHAYKPNGYHWRITLSQLRLLGRAESLHGDHDGSDGSPAHERFFSQRAKDMFGFDDLHHVRQHARSAAAAAAASDSHATVPHAQEGDTHAMDKPYSAQDYNALTRVADVRRAFVLYEDNRTHVALHDTTNGVDLWRRPWATSQESLLRGPLPPSRVAYAYIWLNRTTHIARIPVWRNAHASYDYTVPYLPALTRLPTQDEISRNNTSNNGGALPSDRGVNTTASRHPKMMPPRWAVSPHSAQDAALIPFSYSSWRSDIAADEDEGEELRSYYLEHIVELNDPLTRWLFSEGGQPTHTNFDAAYNQPPYRGEDIGSDGKGKAEDRGGYRGLTRLFVLPGLSWRLVAIVLTHLVLLAGSIGLLCAGVPTRARLQRAWAEVDHNRDVRMRGVTSRPASSKLRPHDPSAPSSRDHTSVTASATSVLRGDSESFQLPAAALLPPKTTTSTTSPRHTMAAGADDANAQDVLSQGNSAATTQSADTSSAATRSESNSSVDGWQPVRHTTSNDQLSSATGQPANDDDDDDDARMGENWWRHTNPTTTTTTTMTSSNRHNKMTTTTTVDGSYDTTTQRSTTDNDITAEHETSLAASQRGGFSQAKLFQQHFNVLRKIGFGGEGSVFCVEHRVTHARYAIKVIRLHDRDDDKEVREAILHSSFDHQNVVRFYFCWIETVPAAVAARLQLLDLDDGMDCPSCSTYRADSSAEVSLTDVVGTATSGRGTSHGGAELIASYRMLFIQMEYFANGTLADLLRNRTGFTNCTNLGYLKSIAEGLAYLHSMDVVHRDLKPTNIFVGKNGVLKIGDFGLAKQRHHNSTAATTYHSTPGDTSYAATEMPSVYGEDEHSVGAGSPLYSSPEQKRGEAVGRPSDIYSLGLLAVEMYCQFTTLHERIRCLTNCRQGIFPDALRNDYPDECKLFARMLADQPARRPTARALVRSFRRLLEQCASAQDAASTTSALSDADEAERQKTLVDEDKSAGGERSPAHIRDDQSMAMSDKHTAVSPSVSQESSTAMPHIVRHGATASGVATPLPTVVRVPMSEAAVCNGDNDDDDDAVNGMTAVPDECTCGATHDAAAAGAQEPIGLGVVTTTACVEAPLPCSVKNGEVQMYGTGADTAQAVPVTTAPGGLSVREQSAATNTFAVSGMLSLTSFAARRPSL